MKHPQSNHIRQSLISLAAGLILSATPSYAADTAVIQVEGSAPEQMEQVTITPSEQPYKPADAADNLKSVPGANVNKNGPMTGIVQYRGMYGG